MLASLQQYASWPDFTALDQTLHVAPAPATSTPFRFLKHLSLQVKDDVEAELAETVLDKFWSLQYMIPAGVLNGFAGPVKLIHADNPRLSMTHAVHLRFGTMQVGGSCSFAHYV